jgi:uncharacterized protein YbbC (DUF1343 family)
VLPSSSLPRLTLAALGAVLSLGAPLGRARGEPSACKASPLPAPGPDDPDVDRGLPHDLDAILAEAVLHRLTPGAALVVLQRGRVLYRGGAGTGRPDAIYDLASLTKVVATAPAAMKLVEEGLLSLDDRAASRLPLLARPDKREITIRQLLLHTSGLPSVVWAGSSPPVTDGSERPAILARIDRALLTGKPGSVYRYSDAGFILLGEIVAARAARAAGAPRGLDGYARSRLFEPLGMCDTMFRPPASLGARLVSPWPAGGKEGQVYDPLAARLGGVAGHAGLYSTADDLARFGQMILAGGELEGRRVLERSSIAEMTRAHPLPVGAGARGLGFDRSSPHATSARGGLSEESFGHIGFTGTSLFIDPPRELVVALLTNRTFLEPAPNANPLRRLVHEVVAAAVPARPRAPVETGLDRLATSGFELLRGRRVALVSNQAAVDGRGRSSFEVLGTARGVELVAVFVPEHGLGAAVDRRITDGAITVGGRRVPVYSLFGSRRRPDDRTLAGVDTIVFDVPVVGVRYYTYLATMGWAMEEAARRKLRFVVLDRPDPLGGAVVTGPVSTEERRTSTSYHPIPVRNGMTLGELARLYNGERRIGADLRVVEMRGWKRGQMFPATGLVWHGPSPNLRSFRQTLLYAGVGLLETTNLSVGRGTETPFQLVGAPWLDGAGLAAALSRRRLPGLHILPARFTPAADPHRGKACSGVRLIVTDAAVLDPVSVGLAIAVELRRQHPDEWSTKHLFRLVGDPRVSAAIEEGKELRDLLALCAPALQRFDRLRRKYLIYK